MLGNPTDDVYSESAVRERLHSEHEHKYATDDGNQSGVDCSTDDDDSSSLDEGNEEKDALEYEEDEEEYDDSLVKATICPAASGLATVNTSLEKIW
jgi:hypothetical protein